jgi:hypothetical protein
MGLLCGALSLPAEPVSAEKGAFDPAALSFDQLMVHASRYGTTGMKRERKKAAKEELRARGGESLAYLLAHTHTENMWFFIYARELVERLEDEVVIPVLLQGLEHEEQDVRKYAIYFLGFRETPEHAARILPFLSEEKLAGVVIRTLGKWHIRKAVPEIVPFLTHERERVRVLAANALGDIGDATAAGPLITALDDRFFTVRRAASRALARLDGETQDVFREAVEESPVRALRRLVPVLARKDVPWARKLLEGLAAHPDAGVRYEVKASGVLTAE